MDRVYIKTYGCQMNERDSEAVAALLAARGYRIVDREEEASVVLLNTCSIREVAEQKAIGKAGYLLKRKRQDPRFLVGILGCMAQNRGRDLLDRLPDLDLIVGTQKFHRTPEMIDRLRLPESSGALVEIGEEEGSENTIRPHLGEAPEISSFVSIMQGCNMRCSFCIVPKTRGAERARPMVDIVEEVRELAERGTREVTLLGQIVNHYGIREFPTIGGKTPFVQLLEQVCDVPGIERVRFTSPHPRGFREDLVEAFQRLPKLGEYVHLPLQSGSDRILKAMKRPYSVDRYRSIVESLREAVPGMHFSTDIIVGFPGETDEDFALTREIFEAIGFEMAFIFKYSPRPGTPAAAMDDAIPEEVKEERNQLLLESLGRHSLARNRSLVGTTQEVLLEGPAKRGEGIFVGRTRGFRKVVVPATARLVGEIVPVEITGASVTTLEGQLKIHNFEEGGTIALASHYQ